MSIVLLYLMYPLLTAIYTNRVSLPNVHSLRFLGPNYLTLNYYYLYYYTTHTHTYPQLIPYSCIDRYQSNHLGTTGI